MLSMDQSQLFDVSKAAKRVVCQGAFFDILREIFNGSDMPGMKGDICSSLKKYNDMASTERIANSMMSILERMSEAMSKSARGG